MKIFTFSSVILLLALSACSSSSSNSDEGITLRLISEQVTRSNGTISVTRYEYDDAGNHVGLTFGDQILNFDIEPDGRIISSTFSADGVTFRDLEIYNYNANGDLRRVDFLGFVESVGVLGVSSFDLYEFEGDVAIRVVARRLPFEDISLFGQVDDSDGIVTFTTQFEYEDERLVRSVDVGNTNTFAPLIQRDYTYNTDGTLLSIQNSGESTNLTVFTYEQGPCNNNWGNSTTVHFCVTN